MTTSRGEWVAVPREPTEAMLRASYDKPGGGWVEQKTRRARTLWRRMLAAAPSVQAVDDAAVERVARRLREAVDSLRAESPDSFLPFDPDLRGDRYFSGPHSQLELTKAQDAFVRACSPANIETLLAALAEPSAVPAPGEDEVERVARALCMSRGINPDALHDDVHDEFPVDESRKNHAGNLVPQYRAWRKQVPHAKAAIAAVAAAPSPVGQHGVAELERVRAVALAEARRTVAAQDQSLHYQRRCVAFVEAASRAHSLLRYPHHSAEERAEAISLLKLVLDGGEPALSAANGGNLHRTLVAAGWLPPAEHEALRGVLHDEMAANLALRENGGALPDEDMPTFCARIIRERNSGPAWLDTVIAQLEVSASGVAVGADKNPGAYAEGVAKGWDDAVSAMKRAVQAHRTVNTLLSLKGDGKPWPTDTGRFA